MHFLESSNRLYSPKLFIESSSSSSSSPSPPAASSQPSVHVIDMNDNNETNNLKQQPPSIFNDVSASDLNIDENLTKSKSKRRRRKTKHDSTDLSNDAKHRAQILLEKLTQAIETRSKQYVLLTTQQNTNDEQQTPKPSDPFTTKLPPRSQRNSTKNNAS